MKKNMKKAFASLLAATMVMSMSVTAWAGKVETTDNDGNTTITYTDDATVTFKKNYVTNWEDTSAISPAETFSFKVHKGVYNATKGEYEDKIEENVNASYPNDLPTINTAEFAEGAVGKSEISGQQTLTINLPTYTAIGVYWYTIEEEIPENPTAGVTYHNDSIILKVTTIQGENGKIRVGAVHCESNNEGDTDKKDNITNIYNADTLTIKKVVDGNMGGKDEYFTVKVKLTAPEKTTVKSSITVNALSYEKTDNESAVNPTSIETIATTGTEYTFKIKNDETITIKNIPEGVTYEVYEVEANTNGYTTTYTLDGETISTTAVGGAIDKYDTAEEGDTTSADAIVITNIKNGAVDTGILLDSAPYVLLLAIAGVGAFAVATKKREEEF